MYYNDVDDQEEIALVVPPEIIRIPTTDMTFMSVLLWLTNNHALQLCRSKTINPVHIQQFASHRVNHLLMLSWSTM